MKRSQHVALAVLAGLTFGSLAATAGYAWYWRSGWYRAHCAGVLSTSLGLPADIGRVVPHSRRSREFDDVRVWLPERRGEAAFCRQAILTRTPTNDDPEAYGLDLRGGQSEISTRTWLRGDYRFVLESGLRPGFDPAGPRRVVFSGMDLSFERDQFRAALHGASGAVSFVDPQVGQANVLCHTLNDHLTAEPVTLHATFSPRATGIRLDRVELVIPELPIAIIGLDELTGLDLRSGSFDGRMVYRETDGSQEVCVSGSLFQVQLAECTAPFLAQPWRGAAPELDLQELTVVNGCLERVRFRSLFAGVNLGDVLAPYGLAAAGGNLLLRIRAADLSRNGVDQLIVSGRCDDISLEQLSDALGWGHLTGKARLVINDLTITQNHLTSLDAEIVVEPAAGQPNSIDRNLVSAVLARVSGITLPTMLLERLPERFDFTELGVRLEVTDEVLRVFGTHGPQGKAILTVSMGGQELPVIFEPADSYDLGSYLDGVRVRLRASVEERLRGITPEEAWRAISEPARRRPGPHSAPSNDPNTE